MSETIAELEKLRVRNDGGRGDIPAETDAAISPDCQVDKSLLELFREQARVQPDRIAVIHHRKRLTYRELAERVSEVASHLRSLGVGSDDCVGVFVDPSIELMVGIWGILFAGAAYLPLSTEYPEDRLRYMIETSVLG